MFTDSSQIKAHFDCFYFFFLHQLDSVSVALHKIIWDNFFKILFMYRKN